MKYLILKHAITTLAEYDLGLDVIDRIELEGTGNLSVCTLSFFNGDEQSMDEYTKIIFTKTDHPSQCILTPHKVINLSDYAYCSLKVFAGNLHPTDKVILYYALVKAVQELS